MGSPPSAPRVVVRADPPRVGTVHDKRVVGSG
jgi:hypothetical protein